MNRRRPTLRIGSVALAATVLLIVVGGYTRGSGSGYGCADRWPLCEGGLLGGWLPRADFNMVVEWSHRWLAAVVGILVLATAVSAWRHHRSDRVVPLLATLVVVTIVFQAWLGRAVVQGALAADLVSAHLAISLLAAALLVAVVVLIRFDPGSDQKPDRSWLILVAGGAGAVFAVILAGSAVHNLFFPGWPLMFDRLVPELQSAPAVWHFVHRAAAGIYAALAVVLWTEARRRGRPGHEVAMLGTAAVLYLVNIVVGAAHVATEVGSAALVATHLGLAAAVWLLTVAAAVSTARLGSEVHHGSTRKVEWVT